MECNKDEALRAKTIAEGKMEKRDYAGARKFVLKAKALYPELDGISQMLMTIDVYTAAANTVAGESDWYGVLGSSPNDDEQAIKKQYRKLVLALHPDKNKSTGADGAFALVCDAWNVLSDRAKRLAYHQKRGLKAFQPKGPSPSAAPSRGSGVFNFTSKKTDFPNVQNRRVNVRKAQTPASVPKKKSVNVPKAQTTSSLPRKKSVKVPPAQAPPNSFWTICHRCKMHHEYVTKYLDQMLLCPTCRVPFMAYETTPPSQFYQQRCDA